MLVVFRFREELAHDRRPARRRCARRWRPPGGRRCSPAATVAIGLALLVFMPLPFMRSMGVGGLLVPLVSIAASATLLPALLALMGARREPLADHPAARPRAPRAAEDAPASGTGSRRRSCAARCCSSARPAGSCSRSRCRRSGCTLTGGDNRGVPLTTESTRGLHVLETTLGPGRARAAPDRRRHRTARGGAGDPAVVAAAARGSWPSCERDPRDRRPRPIVAPAARPAGRTRARPTSSTPTAACCRSAPPGARDSGDAARRWTSSTGSATATCPAARFPAGDRRAA